MHPQYLLQPFKQRPECAGFIHLNMCVLTNVACFSQPARRGSADTHADWASHTGPSQGNMPNEQTSLSNLFVLLFLLFPPWALAFSFPLLPQYSCCLLLFISLCFGSNPYFWQGLTGSLVWRGVTGLAMRQSPVERAHIHTCRFTHSEWGAALTTPKWAISQTAIITTATLLFSIIYFALLSPSPSVFVCVRAVFVCMFWQMSIC